MTATRSRRPPQDQLDMRAIEMAAATQAVMNQHLGECRDRYLSFDAKLDKLLSMLFVASGFIITLLVAVLGYLLAHGGIPISH